MGKGMKIFLIVVAVLVVIGIMMFTTIMNTYNNLVSLDEDVNNAWAQVQNVYQRRADLIPNLVETVKGYASHERETLEAVIQARAKATQPQFNVDNLAQNPQMFERFEQAQSQLSGALSRLMLVIERYPDLKANTNFIRLQDELAGTENRIAVERRRFNETVQQYNRTIRSFPTNMLAGMLGFERRAYFEADPEAQEAPEVDFSNSSN